MLPDVCCLMNEDFHNVVRSIRRCCCWTRAVVAMPQWGCSNWRDIITVPHRGRLRQRRRRQLTWRSGLIVSSSLLPAGLQLTSAHFAEPVLARIWRRFQLRPHTARLLAAAAGANPAARRPTAIQRANVVAWMMPVRCSRHRRRDRKLRRPPNATITHELYRRRRAAPLCLLT